MRDVSIEEIEQGRADWEYHFKSSDMRPCGRQGCKQEHGHGWVIALRDGRYVHIGNDCATKYADPELWKAQTTAYNDRVRAEAQAEALARARDKAQRILWWLDNNQALGDAAKLYCSFQREAYGPLLTDLQERAKKGDSEVRHEVRLSSTEIQRRRDASTQVRSDGTTFTPQVSATEFIRTGALRGVGCFKQHIVGLTRSLEKDSMHLLRSSHGAMTKRELDLAREVMNRIGITQRRVERVASDISLFFSDSNLKMLLSTPVAMKLGLEQVSVESGEVVLLHRLAKRAA